MPPTVPRARDGSITNDEQVYNELLDFSDLDPVGQAWDPRNVLGPPVANHHAHPLLLAHPSAAFAFDEAAPSGLASFLAPRYEPAPVPMAAPPFEPTFPGDHLFNIHSDANPACRPATPAPPAPPAGECNFLFYTPGTNPVKCGCRRFWSSNVGSVGVGDAMAADPYTCMCNHHACFHDLQPAPTQAPATTPAPENDREKAGGEASTPLQDISFRFTPRMSTGLDLPGLDAIAPPVDNPQGAGNTGLGLHLPPQASPAPEGSIPDTLCWADNRQSPVNKYGPLPPIPSQCLMPPSRPSSVAESSQSRYLRPFAGRGLQTLSGVRSSPKGRQPLQERPVDTDPIVAKVVKEQGAGTVREPSQQNIPRSSGHNPSQDLGDTQPFGSSSGQPREALRNLSDAVEAHEQRIDRLENVSFSAAGHEECTDRNEQMDLRVTELESRVDEVERNLNDNGSTAAARAGRSDRFDGSACSMVSDNTTSTARPMHSFEVGSRFMSMEAQISKLEASLPTSYERPWEVEVVFLPFPLRKVWQEAHEFKGDPAKGDCDEWTQLPNTYSAAAMRAQSPFGGEWARGHDFEWFLPKACGPNGLVDRRLRSRGLIRTISVKGPDARSVQAAMSSVFGGVMRDMRAAASSRSRRQSVSSRAAQFLGLTHDWVPLRKIHKDSRLRFLSPAEMVTPALWDVSFLNSVIMKSSEPRLFVTQPEAYVQDMYAYESGWTWRRLRELPRFYPEVEKPGEIPEADAMEEHWAYNEVLDQGSVGSTGRSRSNTPGPPVYVKRQLSNSPSQQYYTTVESMMRSTPSRGTTPAPTRPRKKPAPPEIRTNSVPPSVPAFNSPSSRRVASNGSNERSAIQARAPVGVTKRRQTRSPSRARFTPRWSTKSPSPMIGAQGVRGTTPFNYATPYSNGPAEWVAEPAQPGYVAGRAEESGDEDFDIDIFDDGSYYDYDDDEGDEDEDESVGSVEVVPRLMPAGSQQLPEDEPWPGIEDRMSDGENVDPLAVDGDGDSEMSSQPSEYPSTHAWNGGDAGEFRIHEDAEGR